MSVTNMGEKAEEGVVADGAIARSDPPYPLASGTQENPSDAPWVVREEPISTTREVGKRSESNTERPGSIVDSNFMPVTMYVWPDERCANYREVDLLTPDFTSYHRYRMVHVVRHDALAEYIEDMGPSNRVVGGPVTIIGGEGNVIVETYSSMCEIADQYRAIEMPMPHQNFEMKALERTPDMIDLLARKVI